MSIRVPIDKITKENIDFWKNDYIYNKIKIKRIRITLTKKRYLF